MPSDRNPFEPVVRDRAFATTSWIVVLNAQHCESPGAAAALEQLCRNYWYPLYAYVRRRGHSHEDAQDLVQAFFVHFLERKSLLKVSRERGKFRSLLLASLNYFLADAWDHNRAQKRGGGRELLSLDAEDADHRYHLEASDQWSPEKLFERRWALAIIEQVFNELEREHAAAGKTELYRVLQPFLLGDKSHGTYADAATQLGSTEDAIKMAVSRLRRRYRELFRQVIAQTLEDPSEIEAEFSYLLGVISS